MSSGAQGESRSYLGKYQIIKHIATGGMGAVYRALDTDTSREVAIKVLAPELASRPVMRERLRREALHGARLCHENIVALYDFEETQGTCFLVMEFVEGVDLSDYIAKRGPLAPETARLVLMQMADALEHVHQLGLVHRDIKPSNIMLTRKDERTIAKLADLGLSRETREEDFRLTREGHTVGTVDYLSPEQARNSSLADIRSDIYSLGCTFYHMLTGSPPFSEGSLPERLLKHSEQEAADVRSVNKRVPADLAAICRRMLAKKPEDRYQTPAELLEHLRDPERDSDKTKRARSRKAAADEPLLTTPDEEKEAAAPMSASQRAMVGRFEMAKKAISAGDRAYGIRLLLECCRIEPSAIECRQVLRDTVRANGDPGWLSGVGLLYDKLRLKLAKALRKPHKSLFFGEKVLIHQPDHLNTHLMLAEAAVTCRYWPLAQWLLEEAKKVHGPNVMIHRALAVLGERRGDVKQAIHYWELVSRASPDSGEARHRLKNLAAKDTLTRGHFDERLDETSVN